MAQFVDDTQTIHDELYKNLERVLDAHFPGWIQVGDKGLLTPEKKGMRWSSSFQINLGGDKRGSWNRYSQSIGGSPLNLVAYAVTGNHKGTDAYRAAFDWARDFFGLERRSSETEEQRTARQQKETDARKVRVEKEAAAVQAAATRKARKAQTANEIANECISIANTLADTYLRSRTLPPVSDWPSDQSDHIGFHPALEYDPLRVYEDRQLVSNGPEFPALVFFVRDPFGDIIALQRVFLSPDGSKLETIRPDLDSKVTFGSPSGGACRIGGDGERVGLLEGPETALGTWFLHNCKFPMWSALSTSGLVNFQAPDFVSRLDIFMDGDKAGFDQRGQVYQPPGERAARHAAAEQNAVGVKAVIQEAPMLGDNLNLWEIYKSYAAD